MNCVNLRSMKPAKWLSSPRWMGHRSSKVRTQHCRTEGERKREGNEREGWEVGRGAACSIQGFIYLHILPSFFTLGFRQGVFPPFFVCVTMPLIFAFAEYKYGLWLKQWSVFNFCSTIMQVSCSLEKEG